MSIDSRLAAELSQLAAWPSLAEAARLPDSLQDELRGLWKDIAVAHQVDHEAGYIDPVNFMLFDDSATLQSAIHNWRHWGPHARIEYLNLAQRFTRMTFLSMGHAKKHYPHPNEAPDAIRQRSVGGDSLFFPTWPPSRLEPVFFKTMAAQFKEMLAPFHATIHCDAGEVVGASGGEDTRYICFDISFSVPEGHAYPASEAEAMNDQLLVRSAYLA